MEITSLHQFGCRSQFVNRAKKQRAAKRPRPLSCSLRLVCPGSWPRKDPWAGYWRHHPGTCFQRGKMAGRRTVPLKTKRVSIIWNTCLECICPCSSERVIICGSGNINIVWWLIVLHSSRRKNVSLTRRFGGPPYCFIMLSRSFGVMCCSEGIFIEKKHFLFQLRGVNWNRDSLKALLDVALTKRNVIRGACSTSEQKMQAWNEIAG